MKRPAILATVALMTVALTAPASAEPSRWGYEIGCSDKNDPGQHLNSLGEGTLQEVQAALWELTRDVCGEEISRLTDEDLIIGGSGYVISRLD